MIHTDGIQTIANAPHREYVQGVAPYWDEINDLALVKAIREHVRGDNDARSRYHSHLIGAARVVGVPEDTIREALLATESLTIYEP